MTHRKVYNYRLYPSKRQKRLLRETLEACRYTYNRCLEARIAAYQNGGKTLSEFECNIMVSEWRKSDEKMQAAGTALLHDVSRRVDKSYKGFFRRVKSSEKAGFPRFKGKHRYDSFTNPRFTLKVKDGRIRLTNAIGNVRINYHRPVVGEAKGYTIKRNACGEWFISIYVEQTHGYTYPLDQSKNVGIDVGCSDVVTLSNGEKVANPRFYKRDEKELAKAHRKERYDVVAKINKRIANRRKDFNHKLARRIVDNHDLIFVEDIKPSQMQDGFKTVRKSMSDAGWHQLLTMISYKAEEAGKVFRKVPPAYTTQTCSECGYRRQGEETLSLAERTFTCPSCDHSQGRDHNAARNILAAGLCGLASA